MIQAKYPNGTVVTVYFRSEKEYTAAAEKFEREGAKILKSRLP